MADHYVKLWASILDSSVWREPPAHRLVWIAMLTMSDKHGFVGASIDGLARRANVSEQEAESAVASFLAPDPRSRNQENEGRRIQVVPRGWHILNHGYFRDLQDREEQRVYERTRKAEQRARKSQNVPDASGHDRDRAGQTPVCPLPSSDAASVAVSGRESTRERGSRSVTPVTPATQPDDVSEEVWQEWLHMRLKQKASTSALVLSQTRKKAEAAGMTMDEALTHWVAQGYKGFFPPDKGRNFDGTKKTGGQLWREQNDGSSWESAKDITLPDLLKEGGY